MNTTFHLTQRLDRATYIAESVGFGNVVVRFTHIKNDRPQITEIYESGVFVIRNMAEKIITMFIAEEHQIRKVYSVNGSHAPNWLLTKARKNKKRGYIDGQPIG